MKKYTVIGFYSCSGQIFAHHVTAKNPMHAFTVCSKLFSQNQEFIVCIDGHQSDENEDIYFPGSMIVDADSVIQQPEIFK